MNELLLSERIC